MGAFGGGKGGRMGKRGVDRESIDVRILQNIKFTYPEQS